MVANKNIYSFLEFKQSIKDEKINGFYLVSSSIISKQKSQQHLNSNHEPQMRWSLLKLVESLATQIAGLASNWTNEANLDSIKEVGGW